MTHRHFKKNEQGFVLLETLLALLLLALALMLVTELWQASAQLERRTQTELTLSRQALSTLELARVQPALPVATRTTAVAGGTETTVIQVDPISGLTSISLTYTWQEGGRTHVQQWATLCRQAQSAQ